MRTEFSNTTSGPPSSVRRASTKKKIAKRNYLNEHNTSKKKLVDKLLRRKNNGLQTNQLVDDFLVNLKHRKRYVTRTWSEPHGPTQNSPVERPWSTLLATIRTLLTDMILGDDWWEDAAQDMRDII